MHSASLPGGFVVSNRISDCASSTTFMPARRARQQPVDLVRRVVVHEARAHGAGALEPEQLHDLDGVVVAVPDRDLPRGQLGRDLLRRASRQVEGKRGHTALHRSQSVELDGVREPLEEALPELRLVGDDRLPAERLDVLDGRDEAGEQLVLLRPVLEAVPDGPVLGWAHLVRPQALEQLALAEREPEMRPKNLYGEQSSTSTSQPEASIRPCGP